MKLQLPEIKSYIITMAWACVYAVMWVSLIIYFITWYTIDRRERERKVILVVIITSQITYQQGQAFLITKPGPTDV